MFEYYHDGKVMQVDTIEELIDMIASGEITPRHEKDKILVSEYDARLPLYDIESDYVYLIDWKNIFQRIFYEGYRIVDKQFYDELIHDKDKSEPAIHSANILSWYDFGILDKTFTRMFYQSFVINSYITHCSKPSYNRNLPHIKPYYTISELNFLALNWNLVDKATLDNKELGKICKQVRELDISSSTLIAHQLYIYKVHLIGLVKYYSLYGSYYMNSYLRKKEYDNKNIYLEKQIDIMKKAIEGAPAFDKIHTFYRFVGDDKYFGNLTIGKVYQDPSFMSTTRNPFYRQDGYGFGSIMIEVIVPGNVKGVGLCIESYSNFPTEEEIILMPGSLYELKAIDDDPERFHDHFSLKVKKKYTFEWKGVGKQKDVDAPISPVNVVDIEQIVKDNDLIFPSISDRVDVFTSTYTNADNQFSCTIGKKKYLFVIESYNSNTIYEPFFYFKASDGIMIYTSNKKYGNINMLIELGQVVSVNYYFRYSVTDPSFVIDLDNDYWMTWLSLLAHMFGIRNVIIHSNYILHEEADDSSEKAIAKTRYTFSENIYLYLTKGKRMYDYLQVTPLFSYNQLDILKVIKVDNYVNKSDRNELYRIHKASGIEYMDKFYIHIVDNYPRLINALEKKIEQIYDPNNNPFLNISYSLDSLAYLTDKGIIDETFAPKQSISKGSFKKLVGDKKIRTFKNRLRSLV